MVKPWWPLHSLLWAASGRGLNGSGSHRKTFRVSGHAHCVGRSGCGPQKIDVFDVVIRSIMILFSPGPVIGPTGRAPQRVLATNPTYRRGGRHWSKQCYSVGSCVRVDLVRELLKNILSSEDYAKYSAQLEPPKREEPTIYQDLANKF